MTCLAACSAPSLSADPRAVSETDAAFQALAKGDQPALLAMLPPEVAETPGQVRMIGVMRQMLPPAKAGHYELIGWRNFSGTGGLRQTVVLRYPYDNGEHITASTLFQRPDDETPWKMMNFNIKPSTKEEVAAPVVATSIGKRADP